MGTMREYLQQQQLEIRAAKQEAELQMKLQKLDKVASSCHHLVGTLGRTGVCGNKTAAAQAGGVLLTDDILWNSSAIKGIPEKVKAQIKLARKTIVEDGPQNESDAKKFAQGPFLVFFNPFHIFF